jgi:hypothetical protein
VTRALCRDAGGGLVRTYAHLQNTPGTYFLHPSLPACLQEPELASPFYSFGNVTSIKLIKEKGGKSSSLNWSVERAAAQCRSSGALYRLLVALLHTELSLLWFLGERRGLQAPAARLLPSEDVCPPSSSYPMQGCTIAYFVSSAWPRRVAGRAGRLWPLSPCI